MSTDLIKKQFSDHMKLVEGCQGFSAKLLELATLIHDSIESGGTIFWYGNGGSAADSQHMAAELVSRFKLERKAMASIALSTDTSILTAIGNDYSFDRIFVRQVEALVKKGDICIGLSTSGNSKNVYFAHERAREFGATTVSLLGNEGGTIKSVSDHALVVPSRDTPRIQEMHTFFSHIICDLVEKMAVAKHKLVEPVGA